MHENIRMEEKAKQQKDIKEINIVSSAGGEGTPIVTNKSSTPVNKSSAVDKINKSIN